MRLKVSSRPFAAAVLALGLVSAAASLPPTLTRTDVRWLDRVTFGITTPTVTRYKQLGREKFLDEQLQSSHVDPQPLAMEIAAIPMMQEPAADRIKANRDEQQRISTIATDDEKQKARSALNQAGNEVVYEAMKRHLT